MSICIEHTGASSLAGTSRTFDGEVVTVGRAAGNDIVFDVQHDRLVSGRHVEIRRRGADLVLRDLGSRNGTWIAGQRVTGERALLPGDLVELGVGGPQLRVSLAGEPDLALPAAGATMLAPPRPTATPAARPAPVPAAAPERRPGGGIGQQTLMRVVQSTVAGERRRTKRFAAAIGVVAALVLFVAWPDGGAVAEAGPRLEDAARRSNESIYFVTSQRRAEGRWIDKPGAGTAWHVDDGVLATNAHVAVEFEELAPGGGERLIVRRVQGEDVIELEIESVEIHPGYRDWSRIVREMLPFTPGQGFFDTPPAWDVALMKIAEKDRKKLGFPLELAGDADLADLETAEELGFQGFPTENATGGGFERGRPQTTFRSGRLSKIQDFFLSPGKEEERMLLTVDLKGDGGASGSPIFNAEGKVVALLNSGDAIAMAARGRIMGNNTYAQRVDCLRELLTGKAKEIHEDRVAGWRKRLLERFREGRPGVMAAYEDAVLPALGLDPSKFEVKRVHEDVVKFGPRARSEVWRDRVNRGLYVVVAAARENPVFLGMSGPAGSKAFTPFGEAPWTWGFVADYSGTGVLQASFRWPNDTDLDEAQEIDLVIFEVFRR
ncbi:MAG: trypsin-like peptidase domain-containing protein [Planctomycetota bacterium]